MAERDFDEIPGLTPELAGQLRETRKNGYALVRYPDHYTLAVTVGTPAYAGLAVSGMQTLGEIPELAERLKEYALQIAK